VPGESHDVCIGSGTTVTVDADARCRSLTVEHGATLILPSGVRLTAEQFVINIGTLQQMQLVDSADVPFLEIQNASGTGTLFRGANIASSHNLGEVTVAIHGLTAGEDCTDPSQAPPDSVRRCYNITSASSTAAMIRLWALTYELDGIAQNALSVYHLSDLAMWEPLTANWAVGNDGGSYAFAEGEAIGFSAFLLGLKEDAPTAIVLRCLDTRSGRSMGLGLLLAPPLLLGLGTLWALRRRLDSGQAEG
jgi:hypothetical protein